MGEGDGAARRLVLVIGGPIASGKTTIAHAVRRLLETRGVSAAAIDLDLLYEVLDSPDRPKDNPKTWSRARRLAAALTDALVAEGAGVVIAEGDFLDQGEREEFVSALRSPARPLFVTLTLPLDIALERVRRDPTRGISRDALFLARHYDELSEILRTRPVTDLVIDTSTLSVDRAAEAIVDWTAQFTGAGARSP